MKLAQCDSMLKNTSHSMELQKKEERRTVCSTTWRYRMILPVAGQSRLIMAAQEQALSTRSIQTGVHHARHDSRCRLCKDIPQSIRHITVRCKTLAGRVYTEHHNQVSGIVYRNLCGEMDCKRQGQNGIHLQRWLGMAEQWSCGIPRCRLKNRLRLTDHS